MTRTTSRKKFSFQHSHTIRLVCVASITAASNEQMLFSTVVYVCLRRACVNAFLKIHAMSQPLSQSSSQGFNLSQNTFNRVWDTNDIPSCIGYAPIVGVVQRTTRSFVTFFCHVLLSSRMSPSTIIVQEGKK